MNDLNAIIGGAFLLAVACMALVVWATIEEARQCQVAGGHIISKVVTGFGVSGSGQPATTISTVSFCVSSDGRILEQ